MGQSSDALQPLHFHYLSLVKREYESLIRTAKERARSAGFDFRAEHHSYEVLANLERIKGLLEAENTLVEVPLHTAARLMQEPEVGSTYKAVASAYTFTPEAAKIALYYYGDNPLEVCTLVCTSSDSIATHLFRDYAMRKGGWQLDKIETLEVWDYESVVEHADYETDLISERRLWNCAFLISGTDMIEKMAALMIRKDAPRKLRLRRLGDDIYRTVKDGWHRALGNLNRQLPDLPGTIVVARPSTPDAPFVRTLIDAISAWNLEHGQVLRASNMGLPHIGTPISIVATVVYMELLAKEALQQRVEHLPTLDYAHFYLSEKGTHWDAERAEVVRAVELGADWLFKGRLEFVNETLDLRTYCRLPPSGGDPPAQALAKFDREQLAPLAQRLQELQELADGGSTAAKALREKVDEVFTVLMGAKKAFRLIDPGTRTPHGIPEDRFHPFELPSRRGPVRVRVWMDRWSHVYRPLIEQLIENNVERLQSLLRGASLICEHRRVSNETIRERLASHLDDRAVSQYRFHVRLLFPFIQTEPGHQILSLDRAKAIVHRDDFPVLEAMHDPETADG